MSNDEKVEKLKKLLKDRESDFTGDFTDGDVLDEIYSILHGE